MRVPGCRQLFRLGRWLDRLISVQIRIWWTWFRPKVVDFARGYQGRRLDRAWRADRACRAARSCAARSRPAGGGPCLGGLAPSPGLEGRADREGAREAVRLLVGERSRRWTDLGIASMLMIGLGRAFIAFTFVRDERTGR